MHAHKKGSPDGDHSPLMVAGSPNIAANATSSTVANKTAVKTNDGKGPQGGAHYGKIEKTKNGFSY